MVLSTLVPLDVISQIIEHFTYELLDDLEVYTSQACLQVSRLFLVPSHKSLFHTIHLSPRRDALGQSIIRNLCLRLICPGLTDYSNTTVSWASRDESFHAIMSALPFLRVLSFKFSKTHLFSRDWGTKYRSS